MNRSRSTSQVRSTSRVRSPSVQRSSISYSTLPDHLCHPLSRMKVESIEESGDSNNNEQLVSLLKRATDKKVSASKPEFKQLLEQLNTLLLAQSNFKLSTNSNSFDLLVILLKQNLHCKVSSEQIVGMCPLLSSFLMLVGKEYADGDKDTVKSLQKICTELFNIVKSGKLDDADRLVVFQSLGMHVIMKTFVDWQSIESILNCIIQPIKQKYVVSDESDDSESSEDSSESDDSSDSEDSDQSSDDGKSVLSNRGQYLAKYLELWGCVFIRVPPKLAIQVITNNLETILQMMLPSHCTSVHLAIAAGQTILLIAEKYPQELASMLEEMDLPLDLDDLNQTIDSYCHNSCKVPFARNKNDLKLLRNHFKIIQQCMMPYFAHYIEFSNTSNSPGHYQFDRIYFGHEVLTLNTYGLYAQYNFFKQLLKSSTNFQLAHCGPLREVFDLPVYTNSNSSSKVPTNRLSMAKFDDSKQEIRMQKLEKHKVFEADRRCRSRMRSQSRSDRYDDNNNF